MDISVSSLDNDVASEPASHTKVPVSRSMKATVSKNNAGKTVLLVDNNGDGNTEDTLELEKDPTCTVSADGKLTVTVSTHSSYRDGSVMLAVYQNGKMYDADCVQTTWDDAVELTVDCPDGTSEIKVIKLDENMKPYTQYWSKLITA